MKENMIEEFTILSEKKGVFINNTQIPVRIDTNKHLVVEVFKNYEYPVTAWPVLINKQMSEQLSLLTLKIPELLHLIPSLYFNNDIKKIADFYFGGDEMLAQLAMMCHNKDIKIGCRLDLTYTNDGFKILEVNIGTSIGGWQVQNFEPVIRQYHPELANKETADNYRTIDTQRVYVKFLIEQVISCAGKQNKTINLFISLNDFKEDIEQQQQAVRFFDDLVTHELKSRGINGETFTGDMASLTPTDGNLYFNNKIIHGLIIFGKDVVNITPSVFRAFAMDKIYFPDHLGLALMGDKKNLSILLELAHAGKFAQEDNELILKNIPWTVSIGNKVIEFKGKAYNLPELLETQKDNFVIKHARGFQGKDVFAGKFMEMKEWKEALVQALETNSFIAQEFSDSLNFLAPNQQNQWTPHKLIWGAFGFGNYYGGVWVRMSEVKMDVGVINSATGAVEAIVYEIVD